LIRPTNVWRSREDQSIGLGFVQPQGPWPVLIQRFLLARGLDFNTDFEDLFNPKLKSLADPFVLNGISEAAERVLAAFKNNETICIYADFDLDGTSGLALLYLGLIDLGFKNLIYYQPKRLSEGYGFHAYVVEELKAQGVGLIITVDVGITAFAACEKAKELGVDVIVTDHHLPAHKLPNALVVVNPNSGICKSDLGYLCGAGVAFYFLRAIFRKMVDEKLSDSSAIDLKSYLDFFTIGTLTDLVPLKGDNRVLVKYGLKTLEFTQRPGLLSLLKALNLNGRPLTSQDVGIRFSPKLNALSRLESHILPIHIFLETDMQKAESKVEQVLSLNSDRQTLQAAGEEEALVKLKNWQEKKFVYVSSPSFHRGVMGLIATKLAQEFNCPAFVGSLSPEGVIVGSARIGGGRAVLGGLEASAKVLNRFGGHDAAAGFELLADSEGSFVSSLSQYYANEETDLKEREVFYDLELELSDVTESLQSWLESIGPYGQGFPAPFFCLRRLKINSVYKLKGGHLKISFNQEINGRKIEALYFSPPENAEVNQGEIVDILAELQWNFFAGSKKLQLLLRDVASST
jgi:single-stranded-DNA-specific exonuclease